MSEFEPRERGVENGFASRPRVETPAPRTAAEQARERAVFLVRSVESLGQAVEAVQRAAAANDPARWQQAKQALDRQLVATRKLRDQARASGGAEQELAAAEAALAKHEHAASTLPEAPRGWSEVAREAEIAAIVAAPIDGSARDGWARKMAALKAELGQLSVADSRALASRLTKQHPDDPIARGLAPNLRLTPARFNELLAFLDGARKREALRPQTIATAQSTPAQPMDVLRLDAKEPLARSKPDVKVERAVPAEATRLYLQTNSRSVWDAIRRHLRQTSWPAASVQFTWRDRQMFAEKVVAGLHDTVMANAKAGDIDLSKLDSLLYPFRVHDELSSLLPIQTKDGRSAMAPSRHWVPAIGLRAGQLVQSALIPSIRRMSQRYVDATNARAEQAKHGPLQIQVHDLITSSPLDRVVSNSLVVRGVAEVVPDGTVRPAGRTALRPVRLTWESRDPRLWNWVRADLADASVEEVAASLFSYARGAGDATSYYAYGIAAAPPMFGLPVSWAVQFPEARARAPENIQRGALPDERSDSIAGRLSALAATDAADAIALQQSTPIANADSAAVLASLDDAVIQLGALRTALTPWGLANELTPVIFQSVAKRDALRKAPARDVEAYAAVAFGQRERLGRIAGSVAAAVRAAGQLSASRDEDNPIRPILARYAQAAASARLAITSEEMIVAAQDMQRGLVIKSLQANQLASMQAMGELQSGPAMKDHAPPKDTRSPMDKLRKVPKEPHASRTSSAGARNLSRPYEAAQERARVLENTLLQGGDIDADELQRVQLESQEIALQARLQNLMAHLEVIDDEAKKAGTGLAAKIASLGSSRFRNLTDASTAIRNQLVLVLRDLILDQKVPKPRSGDGDGLNPPPLDVLAKRDALSAAQARFEQIAADRELGTFLEQAHEVIESQRLRTTLVTVGASIGISFVGAGMGAVVAKGMTRALTTVKGAQTAISFGARAGVFAARVATDTVVNAAGEVALTGDDPWKALLENALMTLGSEATVGIIAKEVGAARMFHKQLADQVAHIEAIEAKAAMRSAKLGKAARILGREALEISGHAVMGMALGALSGKILAAIEGKRPQATGGWENAIIHGASVAIGRLAHVRVAARKESLEVLARHSGTADARKLVEHARDLEALSSELIKAPDAKRALDVLAHQERLIVEEIRVIDVLLARADHGGYRPEDLARTKAELAGQLGNAGDVTMLAVKLHLTGLRELAPGTLWSGTPDDIARGVREIRASRPDAKVQTELGTTTVRVGDHVFEFHEVAGARRARPSADHTGTRPPDATHELSNTVVRVPGTQMRGGTQGVAKSDAHTAALLARAKATAGTVHLSGVSDIRPSSQAGTYLVMLSDLSWTSVEVTIARTDGTNPAHLVPNSSRVARLDGIQIRGEHVLQISERLPIDQVDRVVAHGLARLVDAHRRAVRGKYASSDDSVLSPDDRGRIAEISVLARSATSKDPTSAARARAELAMLTEYLGIRDGAPLANERRSAIDAELRSSPEARTELARAIKAPLTDAQRKAAFDDLAAEQADHQRRTAPRDAPPAMSTKPGQRLTREQTAEYARVAARLRHLVSQRTLAKYRAQQAEHPNQHPRIEGVQLGAGAALAGRDPRTLLVDARGRWQSDGADNIAQVGQQLQDLYRARFGDVREVAGPGERIPVEAIRYWEDSLAAQGDVIDGYGTLRTENGKLLLDVKPTDGSAPITFEVGGTVTSAPGFPSENVPGGVWGVSASEAILSVERALRVLSNKKGPHGTVASDALSRLHLIKTTRDADLLRVGEALRDVPPEVIAALRQVDETAHKEQLADTIPLATALDAVKGHERWNELVNLDAADGERQIFFSKEANDEKIKALAKDRDDVKRTWLFAGAGGNAVSAAEIILANTQRAEVTLAAIRQPAGLFENGQFRSMAETHGDAVVAGLANNAGVAVDTARTTKRLHMILDERFDFTTPEISKAENGSQRIELRTKTQDDPSAPVVRDQQRVAGDVFVSALGSPNQLPPEIAALALEARRSDPSRDNKETLASERPVWIEADFAIDGRYLGYTVHIRIGGGYRPFEVRGAASRYVPTEEFQRMGAEGETQLSKIRRAAHEDAHAKSGNFAAGMGPTNVQSGQQHVEKAREQ